jgi:hypothetical protein
LKISNSSVSMYSKSSQVEIYTKEESLNAWIDNDKPKLSDNNGTQGQASVSKITVQQTDILNISAEGKSLLKDKNITDAAVDKANNSVKIGFDLSDFEKRKLLLLQRLLEQLTGKRLRFVLPKDVKIESVDDGLYGIKRADPAPALSTATPLNIAPIQRQGWGIDYKLNESYIEQQKLSFSVSGIVMTSDGRQINLSVQLNMSREFAAAQNISFRAGDAARIDPLVISFDGGIPDLTEEKYSFDIDCDGKLDNISFVAPGSGFLALDLNSDGIINDGSELFGPNSGDGFSDLSKYDSDNNNWIDENDPIYEKLRIWTKDENGNDQLFALGQKGVGAIYLGNIDTQYNLKNTENQMQGQIRKTGIFLNENGTPGLIQHIDLAI